MKLQILKKLGDGGFADVWLARDELDREVAVKIVREASVGVADALAHAKALARATHLPDTGRPTWPIEISPSLRILQQLAVPTQHD